MGKPDKKEIAQFVVLNDVGKSARHIGAQTGHSPNTILKYLADSAKLNDPKVKELISQYREQETDHLALLGGKARALLEERLDEKRMTNIEAIALTDRFFTQRRTLEGKSSSNVFHGVMVKLQRESMMEGLDVPADSAQDKPEGSGKRQEKAGEPPTKPAANT